MALITGRYPSDEIAFADDGKRKGRALQFADNLPTFSLWLWLGKNSMEQNR